MLSLAEVTFGCERWWILRKPLLCFGTRPRGEEMDGGCGSGTSRTCFSMRSSESFLSMTPRSYKADAKFFDRINTSRGTLYLRSAPKRGIGPGYLLRRLAQADDLKGEGEIFSGGLDALATRKYMVVLGLGKAGTNWKACKTWSRLLPVRSTPR